MRKKIVFYLNGIRKEVGPERAGMMLAEYLRYDQCLTGTKIVCAEGDCGACSVLRYFPHAGTGPDAQNYLPINSCITLVAQLDGSSIVTVDALKKNSELHEVQRAMVQCHGSQCGFCTPGFVMAITGLVEEKLARNETSFDDKEAKNCMTGNLCRCTGYQPIINAVLEVDLKKCESVRERYLTEHQLKELEKVFQEGVALESQEFCFFAPKTVNEALGYLAANPDARIIGSGTDLGVVHNKRKLQLSKLLSLHLVSELYEQREEKGDIFLGARVSMSEFRHFIKDRVPELAKYLDVFASPQIKNIATVVGNVANASPIGDTPPALLALRARAVVHGPAGEREVPFSDLFVAYRKINVHPGELITGLRFKRPGKETVLRFFKNANRKDLDISAANLCIRLDRQSEKIDDIVIAAGGVAPTPLRLRRTEDFLKSHPLSSTSVDQAAGILQSEITPISDLRASSSYRRIMVENQFRRFFSEMGIKP